MNKISVSIENVEFTDFLSYECSHNIESLLKVFSFTINIPRDESIIKEGNKVRPLTESEFAKLPANFVELSTILAAPNVSILENTITK